MEITVRKATEDEIARLGCRARPIWEKEVSAFPWSYDEPETCLILEGDVEVTPDGGSPAFGPATCDLPAGMSLPLGDPQGRAEALPVRWTHAPAAGRASRAGAACVLVSYK
jgi:hypothetical protein